MSLLSLAFVTAINVVEVFTKQDTSNLLVVVLITLILTVALLTYGWIWRYLNKKLPRDLKSVENINQGDYRRMVSRIKPDHSIKLVDINEKTSGWIFDGEYYINRLSLIKFPQQFGPDLNLITILVYDDRGENCSIGYRSKIQSCYVTAYIYKGYSNDLSDAFRTELELIADSHPELSIPSNQEFWGIDAETVGDNLNFEGSAFISTALCYDEETIPVKSFIILVQIAENYMKLRATWPSDSRLESKIALSTLRGILIELTISNKVDIFNIKSAMLV